MENEEFLRLCKAKVAEYTNAHMDKTDRQQIHVSAYCCIVRRCVCGNRNHKSYCVEKSCWHIGKVPDHGDSERTYQRADDVPAPLHVGKGKRRTEIKWQNRYCLRTLWMIF